jgi:hypothetical protein
MEQQKYISSQRSQDIERRNDKLNGDVKEELKSNRHRRKWLQHWKEYMKSISQSCSSDKSRGVKCYQERLPKKEEPFQSL